MTARQSELFKKPRRRSPRVLARCTDVGLKTAFFTCERCGWKSGWRRLERPSDHRSGIPCETCNSKPNEVSDV